MRESTRFIPALAFGVAGAILAAAPALAFPIIYTEEATGSGTLNGIAFTDESVVLSMSGVDTTNVGPGPIATSFIISGTATLSLNGATAVAFSDPIQVFSIESESTVGFWDANSNFMNPIDILATSNTAFAMYDLQSFIGPISGTPAPFSTISFPTSGGLFKLSNVAGDTSTFTAVPAPLIGRGPPVLLAVGGVLFGAKLLERSRKGRSPAA